jgi:FkbH-like protein
MVPELPEDPADYVATVAAAGYFEATGVSDDDRKRSEQYQANAAREAAKTTATDLPAYLRSLEMKLIWRNFDRVGLTRIVQLINKTNQFNLTTRRYTEADVLAKMEQEQKSRALTLQLRLTDRFGDNGIISLLIGELDADRTLWMDTWLMSCRVLGRQVEEATLNLLAAEAKAIGARAIGGVYLPTKKNGMVREHYGRLGFEKTEESADGSSRWRLALDGFAPHPVLMETVEGEQANDGATRPGADLLAAH